MTPREFRQEQEFSSDHFTKLTSTGFEPNYVNIELFAHEYHKHKLKLLGISDVTHISFMNEDGSCHTITDGYSTWSKKCCECGKLSMQVVRPGKVQCCYCG